MLMASATPRNFPRRMCRRKEDVLRQVIKRQRLSRGSTVGTTAGGHGVGDSGDTARSRALSLSRARARSEIWFVPAAADRIRRATLTVGSKDMTNNACLTSQLNVGREMPLCSSGARPRLVGTNEHQRPYRRTPGEVRLKQGPETGHLASGTELCRDWRSRVADASATRSFVW